MSTIEELQEEIAEVNKFAGWGEEYKDIRPIDMVAILCTNLHGEVSELWEAARRGELDEPCDKAWEDGSGDKLDLNCQEEELADIFIRTLDAANWLGVDLATAVRRKLNFNAWRGHRHGGKLA